MKQSLNHLSTEHITRRANDKKAKIKLAKDKVLAKKTIKKGLIIIHTGTGKGKTTAAIGIAVRAIGNGMKVGIVQFIKGAKSAGERKVLESFKDLCQIKAMGDGFTWDTQNRDKDIESAQKAWQSARQMIHDKNMQIVILDEINIALRYDYLDVNEVVNVLKSKPKNLHIILTGRNAKPEIIAIGDLITEMKLIKHPFQANIGAQIGIEF